MSIDAVDIVSVSLLLKEQPYEFEILAVNSLTVDYFYLLIKYFPPGWITTNL